ncbi:MAG: DUF2799 domain-containing protein [Proteobacteria bacterium]|nr:DUF2799 domain-containing protein [Pseudomonadota bacterium]
MKRQWAGISVSLLILGITGCATMSGDECATSDWSAVGYEDGARGLTTERFSKHRKACAKHGITADFQSYQQGRSQGLVEFCQPGRGFNLGANGGRYNGVCAADLEPEFLDAYRAGQQLYTLRSYVSSAGSQIYNNERELEAIKVEVRDKEALLIGANTSTQDRVLLLADLKDLSERTGELEAEIDALIADRARHEQDLRHYEQTVTAYGY